MSISVRRGIHLASLRPDSPRVVGADTDNGVHEVTVADGHLSFSEKYPSFRVEDIVLHETLGSGASSTVVRATYTKSGQSFALKRIPFRESQSVLQQIIQEIYALRHLRHPNIVELQTAFYINGCINIMTNLVDGGSLSDYLKLTPQLQEPTIGKICWYILQGLHYLRQQRFLHRDLKPSNVLISRTGQVLIADFGMSRHLNASVEKAESFLGTMCYMSPERLKNESYGFESDIWSLGLILYECALGRFPLTGNPLKFDYWDLISEFEKSLNVKLPPQYSPALTKFITKCLQVDPDERASVDELLADPWIQQFSEGKHEQALTTWLSVVEKKKIERDASLRSVSLKDLGIKRKE